MLETARAKNREGAAFGIWGSGKGVKMLPEKRSVIVSSVQAQGRTLNGLAPEGAS